MNPIIKKLVEAIANDAADRQWIKTLFNSDDFVSETFTEDCKGDIRSFVDLTRYFRKGEPDRFAIEWKAHLPQANGESYFAGRKVSLDVDEKTFKTFRVTLLNRTTSEIA